MGYLWGGIAGIIALIINFISDYFATLPVNRHLVLDDLPRYIFFIIWFSLLIVYDRLLRSEKGRKFLRKIPIKAIQRKANDIPRTIANREERNVESKQENEE